MSRNLRKYARQTTTRLIFGGMLIIFVIGDWLIYLIYGSQAAGMGLLCLGIGLFPLVLIYIVFSFIDWVIKRSQS